MEHFNEKIIGWFTFKRLYSDMVKKFPSGSTFIEVGCYEGKSFAYLMVEMVNAEKTFNITAVDSFTFTGENGKPILQNFIEHMKPFNGMYNIIKANSWDAAKMFEDESVDYIHIDCDHVYESVKKDINAWWPKLKVGCIMSGHDYLCVEHPGVEQAVHEFFGKENICTDYVDELCWLIKKK